MSATAPAVIDGHVVLRDGYDADAYDRVRSELANLRQVEADGSKRDRHFPDLCEDVFSAVFKARPTLTDRHSGGATHEALLRDMIASTEYRQLRATTKLDEVASALATVELGRALAGKLPETDPDARRRWVRQAVDAADAAVQDSLEACAALAGRDDGPGQGRTSLAQVVATAQRVAGSDRLRRIMRLAGRMKRLARAAHAKRVRHAPDEVQDVELGRDLSRALASELASLRHPLLRRDTLLRYSEGRLLQYRLEGKERQGRGPIVACLDSSGSMAGAPEVWSKALVLGLLVLAQLEKRAMSVIIFGSSSQLRRFDLPAGPVDQAVLLAALEFSWMGGTDFDAPLSAALKACEESRFRQADVVFVTDGWASVNAPEILRRKAACGARLWSVMIGTRAQSLTPVSDGVAYQQDLSDDAPALDLAFGI